MCETGFVFSSKSLLSFRREWLNRGYQWLQEVWIPRWGEGEDRG